MRVEGGRNIAEGQGSFAVKGTKERRVSLVNHFCSTEESVVKMKYGGNFI